MTKQSSLNGTNQDIDQQALGYSIRCPCGRRERAASTKQYRRPGRRRMMVMSSCSDENVYDVFSYLHIISDTY
jgi:hypothetical protein